MLIRPRVVVWVAVAFVGIVALASPTLLSAEDAGPAPDFSRDVRPILSDHCFACHGPDEHERAADLRLDTAEGLSSVVEPTDIDGSELIARIDSDDVDVLMPPTKFHKPLTERQRRVLRQWIEAGAEFQQHWAFVAPSREADFNLDSKGRSPIDVLIELQANEAGLDVNERADRRTLIRRVSLDLTGLPPTRAQVARFLSDDSPDAYERLVDRMLDSPDFGQHVGRYWLDLVRYADTHGLHLDNYREMWPYRDWVIDAVNANMPFDEFLTLQLAGDLMPDANDAQKIASGFNRLNVTTNEGGSIYDEVFTRNVIDRTDAFGTIFLGLTTGCAVCHDHKFDPISSQDYYSLFAFFNSLDGRAMDANVKNPAPVIPVPTEEQKSLVSEFSQSLVDLKQTMAGPLESVDEAQQIWERALISGNESRSELLRPSSVESEAGIEMKIREDDSVEIEGTAAAKDTTTIVASLPSGTQWQTLRLEALTDQPDQRVGVSENGNVVLSEVTVEITDALSKGEWIQIPISHGFADLEQQDGPFAVSYAIDSKVNDSEGWAAAGHTKTGGRTAWFVVPGLLADGDDAKIRVRLKYQSKFPKHQFRRVRLSVSDTAPSVPPEQRIELGTLHTAGPFPVESPNPGYGRKFASQQGEFKADEEFNHEDRPYRWQDRNDLREVEVNDLPIVKDRSSVVVLHQRLTAPAPLKVTLLLGTDDGHVVFLAGKQVGIRRGPAKLNPLAQEYELSLKKGDNDLYIKVVNHSGTSQLTYAFRSPAIDVPRKLVKLLSVPEEKRTAEDQTALQKFYRKVYCLHPDWLALVDQENGVRKAQEKLNSQIATTLVWKELGTPRQSHILTRGQYDQPGEAVPRATPPFLPSMPEGAPMNRLGLAQWLVAPNHPLTARVTVNRFWQQIFGTGLVKTSEDFGSQGEPPSHPELLDWLAVDFQENGWDVKRLLKMLVMSEAYCRSARVSDRMQSIDPANRLLARGPRHRLDAEVLRDQALFVSGLMVDQPGGPSVKPPQPDGLWAAVGYSGSNTVRFKADIGDKIYRRSVYTFWKRTSPPPQMSTFDAPSRESCTARRERTNTPLQALLLMNEKQYVLAANHLAKLVVSASEPQSDADRIDWLYETVTARKPTASERNEITGLLEDLRIYYSDRPQLALQLGETSDANEAAWTILASTVLNLDEVVSK
ncbi:MAG: DUF1553 domain-containing protein [Rubripirellula sp.]